MVDAYSYQEKGEVCPANWEPEKSDADRKNTAEYLSVN
jgi:alkyl hydroperoxide reductase subunit AhpC